ncbi:DUF4388 domain-containing protein [Plectonema cf. radiosum LEGE 06105]|uniref:DUF4388 domain-containing protein n=1 Tax=Plectonema cf. radiosum LEGE 06105 TaxID=945769 RepID=A0A8J7FDU3_9CYAN|nr:DUF4388 domain-containing protein [Plectonema radiosum]MBE9214583.1 DUF4388 domain-containing protein [Plectonema cf. radiosum LEGE 06105]
MTLSSSFTDFSLAELFQLIEQGRKSGCLNVCTLPDINSPQSKAKYFYIWFRNGRVVAAAHRLNGRGLVAKIAQRNWTEPQILENIYSNTSTTTPFGLQLKTQEVLSAEQLNLLFANQLQQVRQLFEIQKGVFKLDCKASLPMTEMTGLSLKATEVTLMALRVLKNWQVLEAALPNVESGIRNISQSKPQLRLNAFEWQIWEFASGDISIKDIAVQLHQPAIKIQQAAFRLMLVGLIEEVPQVTSNSHSYNYDMDLTWVNKYGSRAAKKHQESQTPQVSSSLLQNLVGYLRSKA